MKYWLMRGPIHSDETHSSLIGKKWPYRKICPEPDLKSGDTVYLMGAYSLHGWGWVSDIKPYYDDDFREDRWEVGVFRPVLRDVITLNDFLKTPELNPLYTTAPDKNLIRLTSTHVKRLNQIFRVQGIESPQDPPEDYDTLPTNEKIGEIEFTFYYGNPIHIAETRQFEFKEIKGSNPVDSIKNTADEYAVAWLNFREGSGGRILWGIRNDDKVVVGVLLDYAQQDKIRREVSSKLEKIQPRPPKSILQNFHSVVDDNNKEIPNRFVYELVIPRGEPTKLYATEGDGVWIKTDGGKHKLNHQQKIDEIIKRHSR